MADVLHSPEAEASVLGGLMLAPEMFPDVAAVVGAADFCGEMNRRIFASMARLVARGVPPDMMTLADDMHAGGALAEGAEFAYLGVLVRDTPSAANAVNYAKIVRRFAVRRRLGEIGLRLIERSRREPDPEKTLLDLRAALDGLDAGADVGGPVLLRDLLDGVIDEIDKRFNGVAPRGMATGLADFDKITLGLHDGDLVVVAGRPGMGKSVFGLQLAERVATENNRPALFITAEMPNAQQVERLIAAKGRIELGRIRSGDLTDQHWAGLSSAVCLLSDSRVWFDETPSPRLDDLLSKARKLHRRHGPLGLVVVDHAGLVETGGENRQQAQAVVGRSLKSLAKELSCPVVALVQLNRGLEQRGDRRPMMADLRDSGEWEQSADVVAMIYRDEVYDEKSADKGCAEILVRKNRGGETGKLALSFQGEFSRFDNLLGGLPSRSTPATAKSGMDRGISF